MYFSRVQLRPDIQRSSQLAHVLAANSYGLHQLLWDLFPQEEKCTKEKRSFLFREEIAKEQLKNQRGIKGESLFYLVSKQEPSCDTPIFRVESKSYAPALRAGDLLSFKLRANPVVARKTAGKKHSVRHDVVMDAQRSLLRELAAYLDLFVAENEEKSTLRSKVFKSWRKSGNSSCSEKLHEVISANERFESLLEQRMTSEQLFDWALKANSDSALEKWFVDKGDRNGFELVRDNNPDGNNEKSPLKFQAASYRWHAMPKKGKSAGFSSVDFDGELTVTDPELFQAMLFNGVGPSKAFGCGLMMVGRF